MMKKLLLVLVLLLVCTTSVSAEEKMYPRFSDGGGISIAVTQTATAGAVIGTGRNVVCLNTGSDVAYINISSSSAAVATVADWPCAADAYCPFEKPSFGGGAPSYYLSAIADSGNTATLKCIPTD